MAKRTRIKKELKGRTAKRRPGGRKTSMSPTAVDTAIRMYEMGWTDATVADILGISSKTLTNWRKRDARFKARCNKARAQGRSAATEELFEIMLNAKSDAVRLEAVKFFLQRRSEEFQQRELVEVGEYNPDESFL